MCFPPYHKLLGGKLRFFVCCVLLYAVLFFDSVETSRGHTEMSSPLLAHTDIDQVKFYRLAKIMFYNFTGEKLVLPKNHFPKMTSVINGKPEMQT